MEDTQVVPDVIESSPEETLIVKYGSIECTAGETLKPVQVRSPPELDWGADDEAFYTVCMTDPDAPSRKDPKSREWHHWLVVNIPGKNVKDGETLSEYIGAGPPKGTGLHRYVLLVYKQNEKIKCDEKKLSSNSGAGRGKFSIKNFAKKYDLGQPIAGNVFLAEWDDYVPKLQKQLTG
ncbi:protein D2-like [Coccinella septempunctata]|uniref:protein D2-like n=1 Tax=Coccinella septempunctata TaxID=41139 RepID=UPI001D07C6DC|nr:protein D2-like [Coccinella septempunctata]